MFHVLACPFCTQRGPQSAPNGSPMRLPDLNPNCRHRWRLGDENRIPLRSPNAEAVSAPPLKVYVGRGHRPVVSVIFLPLWTEIRVNDADIGNLKKKLRHWLASGCGGWCSVTEAAVHRRTWGAGVSLVFSVFDGRGSKAETGRMPRSCRYGLFQHFVCLDWCMKSIAQCGWRRHRGIDAQSHGVMPSFHHIVQQ